MVKTQYQARNWHAVTWGAFLLWLTYGLSAQLTPRMKRELAPPQLNASGNAVSVYAAETKIGWPVAFQTVAYASPASPLTTINSWFGLAADVAIIAVVQCSIVVVCQTYGQFSLQQLMGLALLVALMMTVGRMLLAVVPNWGVAHLLNAIYISPTLIVMLQTLLWLIPNYCHVSFLERSKRFGS